MRILHVLDHSLPHQSGYVSRSQGILHAQRLRGWETIQITSAKQGEAMRHRKGDTLHFFRTATLQGWLWQLPVLAQLATIIGLSRRLHRLARKLRPDLLHAHSPALNGLAALYVGHQLGLPVVYEVRAFWEDAAGDRTTGAVRGCRYWLSRTMENLVLRHAAAITTICAGLRCDLLSRGIAASRITVIPNAVASTTFASAGLSAPLPRAEEARPQPILGYAGSYYAYEGLDLLIAALPPLLEPYPQLHLYCAGGGPQEAALARQVAQLGLQQHVTFLGRQCTSQVVQLYRLADIMVYPRRSMRLTELVTPLKPLEAMLHGTMVLASDVGGHRELITDGQTGTLFRAGDLAHLIEQLKFLLSQPQRWQLLRENALTFVRNERNWQHTVAGYEGVYRSVLR